jgi:hypothetical protein
MVVNVNCHGNNKYLLKFRPLLCTIGRGGVETKGHDGEWY